MCGILGLFKKEGLKKDDITSVKLSIKEISYRGPDASGINLYDNFIFAHCRLSIIDLDQRSNQPMIDKENGNIIIFNGEIYNFENLKKRLIKKGIKFLTNSDTEVLLKGFAFYGVDFFKKLKGMFSLAIYVKNLKRVFLARDFSGEKPLYYYHNDNQFIFSSEIKSIIPLIDRKLDIDESELSHFLRNGYSSFNNTILKDLKQIKPGYVIQFDERTNEISNLGTFSIRDFLLNKEDDKGNLVDNLYVLLKKSVKNQLIADVPIGTLLSGGLDSSVLTTIAAKLNPEISAFSVRFPDGENAKDIQLSKDLASKLGIKHNVHNYTGPSTLQTYNYPDEEYLP